ncbi:cytochrome P450 [Actinokineospora soli]
MTAPVAPGRWPLLGHTPALLRRRYGFTDELARQADVVSLFLGPLQTYCVTAPELVHRVLVTDADAFEKGRMFDKFRDYVGNGLVLSAGAFHRRQRKLMHPAFERGRIAGYVPLMVRAATDLTATWTPGQVRRVDHDMQALATTIVGGALFGSGLGDAAIAEARRSIPEIIRYGMVRVVSPGFVEKLPLPANRRFDGAVARMRAIVGELVERRRAEDVDHGDLLSTLLLARDETGAGMADDQVHDEVVTLLSAGLETSALALTWLFCELGRHPEVEERVLAEVDALDGPVTFDDLPRLPNLRRAIDETLRMYPLWMVMRRATEDIELGGVRLRAGDEVVISPHALHHDPRWFPDPHRFDPDRWLTADVPKGGYIPFGAGVRRCIGAAFALTEITAVAATIAARWRLLPLPGHRVSVKYTSTAYPRSLPMTAVPRS